MLHGSLKRYRNIGLTPRMKLKWFWWGPLKQLSNGEGEIWSWAEENWEEMQKYACEEKQVFPTLMKNLSILKSMHKDCQWHETGKQIKPTKVPGRKSSLAAQKSNFLYRSKRMGGAGPKGLKTLNSRQTPVMEIRRKYPNFPGQSQQQPKLWSCRWGSSTGTSVGVYTQKKIYQLIPAKSWFESLQNPSPWGKKSWRKSWNHVYIASNMQFIFLPRFGGNLHPAA